MADEDLRQTFLAFCSFGDRGNGGAMTGAQFSKFCRETKIQHRLVSSTEIDITFSRVKQGGRKIDYAQFMTAVQHLAQRRFPKADAAGALAKLKQLVAKAGGPGKTGVTEADTSGVYGKFTDESKYTGAHAARFADVPSVHTPREADIAVASGEALEDEARAAFAKYDVNHNNSIEESELKALLQDMGFPVEDVHAEYEAAGGHGSGIGWDDFVLFYNKLKARKHGHARRRRKAGGSGGAKVEEDENAVPTADSVETVFNRFCAFGGHKGAGALEMDNAHFAKFAKETGLVHRKGRLTVTDVDLIFSQVKTKGQRKIKYAQFESALELIAAKLYPKAGDGVSRVHDQVLAAGGPRSSGTRAAKDGFTKRMTDTSKYTGAHKARFDKDGKGRGKAGRVSSNKVEDLSQITRTNLGPKA